MALEDIRGKFDSGMVTGKSAMDLGTSESPLARNINPADALGGQTRPGSTFFGSIAAGSGFIGAGLFAWARNAGTTYHLISFGTSIYSMDSSGSSVVVKTGLNSDTYMAGAALANLGVIVAASMAPQVSSLGSTLQNLGGTPPSLARYVAIYAAKAWLAGDPSNPTKISFSVSNNPEDWTTANNAGNITIGDSGDIIKGLEGTKRALYVFMRKSLYIVTGDSPFNFRVDLMANIGLVSEYGHATDGQGCFFASDDGIYYVSGYNIALISEKIADTYANISDKSTLSLEVKSDKLFMTYKDTGDTQNSKAMVLAFKRKMSDGRVDGVWMQYTGQPYQVLDTSRSNALYAVTNASSLQVYEIDTGTSGAVTAVWYTPHYDFGEPTGIKTLMRYYLTAHSPLSTTTVNVHPMIDGASTGSSVAFSIGTTASYQIVTAPGQITTSLAKAHLGLRIEWTGNLRMLSYRMIADVRTDEPPRRVS